MKWLDLEVWATTAGAGTHGREKDAPSPPPPPDYSGIAATNAEASRYAKEAADNDLAFRKQVYDESKPRQQQLADLASQVATQQMGIARTNEQRANEQWGYYNQTYRPNELTSAGDAYGASYLNDSEREDLYGVLSGKRTQDAGDAATVLNRYSKTAEDRAGAQAVEKADAVTNSSTAQAMRAIQRMGGDPSRFAAAAADLSSRQTATRVGASNQARESVRGQGVGLRSGVANFGRNMPNTAGQAFGLATQAGTNATANQNAAANAGLPQAQFQAGGYGTQMGAAGVQQQGALGLGQIMAGTYGSQVSGYGAQANAQGKADAANMEAIGTAVGVAAMFF